MGHVEDQPDESLEVRRKIAAGFNCIPEEDYAAVTGYMHTTIDDMSRRGRGPLPMRIGKFRYYDLDDIKAHMLATRRVREATVKAALV